MKADGEIPKNGRIRLLFDCGTAINKQAALYGAACLFAHFELLVTSSALTFNFSAPSKSCLPRVYSM